jgi:hypothetical protein
MKLNRLHSYKNAPQGALRLALLGVSIASMAAHAAAPALVDDFSSEEATTLETPRLVINDASLGGQSTAELTTEDGVLRVEGKLVPARGQPAFVSLVLLLSQAGEPEDLSQYSGIRLRVHVLKGGLQVVAASADIQNYDYHTAPVKRSGDFQEIQIPFADLKRIWSEQVPLNLTRITSINLVASGMQPGTFTYEIDEIGFY